MSIARLIKNEDGATAIMVASMMLFLLGMAALVIDVGFGFNERRQDQTAADVSVMAGSIDFFGSDAAIYASVRDYASKNVDTSFTNAQWDAMWQSCTDPEKALGAMAAFHWTPLVVGGNTINCINTDGAGFLRVRVPNQVVNTTFAKVLGVNQLTTNAAAVAYLGPTIPGGVLPFGVLSGAGDGGEICLRDSSGGAAAPPCDGGDTGNYGAIISPQFGNPKLGTVAANNCNRNKSAELAINIAAGIDHAIATHPTAPPAPPAGILDVCFNRGVNTLDTFTGISGGLEEGMVTGPVMFGFTPRLQQGTNAKRSVETDVGMRNLDNKPLWEYINPALTGGAATATQVPATCVASSFDGGTFDWDPLVPGLEPNRSHAHMAKCLQDYVMGSYSTTMFVTNIQYSPRFAFVPQFWENSWPMGSSAPRRIKDFRAVYLEGIWLKLPGSGPDLVFYPGEGTASLCAGPCNANANVQQLSGFLIPESAYPASLKYPAPTGSQPYKRELYR